MEPKPSGALADDVLTDGLIERVADNVLGMIRLNRASGGTSSPAEVKNAIRTALRDEREPVHVITVEVRAGTRHAALEKLYFAARQGELTIRRDIRFIDPAEEDPGDREEEL